MSEKPWWWPKITDVAWCQKMRDEYPEAAGWSDDAVRDYYADGQKYQTLWDHTGDAYDEYEKVADALLSTTPPVGTLEVRHTPEGSTEVRLEIGALHLTHRTNASGIPPGTYTIHEIEK